MNDSEDKVIELAPGPGKRRCPACGKPAIKASRPFCSKRCADLDLGNWLDGAYAIPAQEEDDPDAVDFEDR